MGYSPWGRKELDMTEWLHFHFSLSCTGEGNGNPLQYSCQENPRDGAWWAAVYGVTQGRKRLTWLSSSNRNYQHVYMRVPSGQNYVLFTVYHVNCCVNCCLVNIKYPIYEHSKAEMESKIHISFMFFISQNKIKIFKPAWNPNFRMIWALSNIKQTCTGRDCLIFSHSLLSGITLPI